MSKKRNKYEQSTINEGAAFIVIMIALISWILFVGYYESHKYSTMPIPLKREALTILSINNEHYAFNIEAVSETGVIYQHFSKFCHNFEDYAGVKKGDVIYLSTYKTSLINVC